MSIPRHFHSLPIFFLVALWFLVFSPVKAQDFVPCTVVGTNEPGVEGQENDPLTGKPVCLAINRQPALYTGAFGDCLGNSQMEITRFSAAYYKDNMTLSFELEGHTNLTGGAIVMYVTVFAYGENRYQYLWDPCGSSSQNICPLNNTRPFYSTTVIPLGASDTENIPPIALVIPDFEGQAVMRIFSNKTQNEIACYSAAITNGVSFSQPAAVGTVVGLFVAMAIGASFLTAIYGTDIAETRLHYAHSMSVWVIFAVLQHIFFTGALSVNWPAVLPAFWSNFAWAAGMIYSPSMQENLSHFAGDDYGNTTFVGAAETGSSSDSTGGGYSKSQIYTRGAKTLMGRTPAKLQDAIRAVEEFNRPGNNILMKRADGGGATFGWFGQPVKHGLPLPGNYSGFAGTLSKEDIPASNAFMTGFLWLIIILIILTASVVAFKWLLEGLVKLEWIKQNRLSLFRSHYLRYTGQVALRTVFISFFMIMFLTMFQFSYHGAPGPVAIASLVFILFFCGGIALTYLVFRERTRQGCFIQSPDRLHCEIAKAFPPFAFTLESKRPKDTKSLFSIPWIAIEYSSDDPQGQNIHQDEGYIKKYGWLTTRFRAKEWWFFGLWMVYDFIRACFLGGAAGHPQTQVFALLVIEFLAFFIMIKIRPFEGNRLNTLMIWLLGLSKIVTTALSSAFDPAFNLARILTTALGIIIIVIQGILLIAMLILIVIGAVSSYMSVKRNRAEFYPEHWRPAKNAYFRHLRGESKKPKEPKEQDPADFFQSRLDENKKPYFRVESIRRVPKIDENDSDDAHTFDPYGSRISLHDHASPISVAPPIPGTHSRKTSRAFSANSGSLPFGARASRAASWSSHDMVWSAVDSRPSSAQFSGPVPQVPRIPDSIRSREGMVNVDASGYQITPSRARTSTMRSVSSPMGSNRNSAKEEIPLEVMKPRNRNSANSEGSNSVMSPTKSHGPSPLSAAQTVTVQRESEENNTQVVKPAESDPANKTATVVETVEVGKQDGNSPLSSTENKTANISEAALAA